MTDAISQTITWLKWAGCLMWSHPQATAVVSALATVLSAVIAVCALRHTARSVRESVNTLHYTELDSMYLELLKVAIDKPYLRQPDAIYRNPLKKSVQEREYDIYARMIWNFLETIADRCKDDTNLANTWHPVIQDEGTVHKQWIEQEPKGFSEKFRQRFRSEGEFGDKFMRRNI